MKGKSVINFLAYVAVALIAFSLLVSFILGKIGLNSEVISAINLIAQVIAYAITAIFAFLYAKSRRNIWFMVAYVIAIVLIIVMIVL